MATNNAPVPYTANDIVIPPGFNEDIDLLIQTYASDLTPREFSLAIASAHQRGLSIVKKQIYFWKQGGKMIEVVGIDGFRSIAESHRDYAGQDGPYWCAEDGVWKDVWLSSDPPRAARVGILRQGFGQPLYGIALWSEFNKGNDTWKKMPTIMLAKCAEAQAIRKAFPEQLGGLYIPEEIIETTGRVVTRGTGENRSAVAGNGRPASASVEDPERTKAKGQLWHIANKTYGWDQETLDLVSVEETGKHLVDHDAQGLKDLMVALSTKTPDALRNLVDRATAIEA